MNSLLSKVFYFLSTAAFVYSFYNASLVVESLFQKSSEASGPIYEEAKQLIYISAGFLCIAIILLLLGRKISRAGT